MGSIGSSTIKPLTEKIDMDGTSIGLSKKHAYTIGGIIIIFSLLFITPPNPLTIWDDVLLNLPIAYGIMTITGLDFVTAILITYTVIPITLFLLGVWIYPGSTINNIKLRIHKATNASQRLIHNPFVWLLAGVTIYFMWQYYTDGGSWVITNLLEMVT